jgi:hypothetical protein
MTGKANPNRLIRYPLSWPAWLAEWSAAAANDRAQSVADWLRQAAIEKLERDGYQASADKVPQ